LYRNVETKKHNLQQNDVKIVNCNSKWCENCEHQTRIYCELYINFDLWM